MALAVFLISAIALVVGALTLWVNFRSYVLQTISTKGDPGQQLSPKEAAAAFTEIEEKDPVRAIAARYVFVEAEKKLVGYISRQPIAVYLDLHTASCVPKNRAVLAKSLGEFIRQSTEIGKGNLSVATPREGNLILGASVAEYLDLNYLMIRTGRAPRFGYPVEGTFHAGSRAIIVDDLCMEGSFLTRCVKYLRKYGLNISDCFCLFERLDGDVREALEAVSVKLHSKYQIDDQELEKLQTAIKLAETPAEVTLKGTG